MDNSERISSSKDSGLNESTDEEDEKIGRDDYFARADGTDSVYDDSEDLIMQPHIQQNTTWKCQLPAEYKQRAHNLYSILPGHEISKPSERNAANPDARKATSSFQIPFSNLDERKLRKPSISLELTEGGMKTQDIPLQGNLYSISKGSDFAIVPNSIGGFTVMRFKIERKYKDKPLRGKMLNFRYIVENASDDDAGLFIWKMKLENNVEYNGNFEIGISTPLLPESEECREFDRMHIKDIPGKNELPNQMQLNDLCKKYGRKSKFVLDICSQISIDIKSKDAEKIVHVWPVYQSGIEDKIAFVVVVTDSNITLEKVGYSLKIRVVKDYSQEGKEVMNLNSKHKNHLPQDDTDKIRSSISHHAANLMKNHKYLSIISGSSVRSKGYGTQAFKMIHEACIVLYVHTKGYIPLEEEPFKNQYSGVPVDVREGEFELYGKFATEFHETLPLSCQIGSSSDRVSQTRLGGALGCFIDHPEYNLCALTCAHVLLFPDKMEKLKDTGSLSWPSFQSHDQVYQPHDSTEYIGRIVQAVYDEGGENRCGFEVAIFQVETRHPTSGKFPRMRNTGSELEICFDSGKSYGFSRIGKNKAIKIGPVTDLRTGCFELENHHTAVRTMPKEFHHGNVQIKLCHQIEVSPADRNSNGELMPFAEIGDSGALVFINENENDLVCVGIVEGGTTYGTTIVAPIKPILNGLNVNNIKSFENENVIKRIKNIDSKLDALDKNLSLFANEILKRLGDK